MSNRVQSPLNERRRLINEMKEQSHEQAAAAVRVIRTKQAAQYQKTFLFWNDSRRNKFPKPTMWFKSSIKWTGRGHYITIRTRAVANGTTPHKLWYWLDKGTPTIIQPKTSPPIPERRGLRTTPNTLTVTPFKGYTGRYFRVKAGRPRRGIPARNWSATMGDELTAYLTPALRRSYEIKRIIANGSAIR